MLLSATVGEAGAVCHVSVSMAAFIENDNQGVRKKKQNDDQMTH